MLSRLNFWTVQELIFTLGNDLLLVYYGLIENTCIRFLCHVLRTSVRSESYEDKAEPSLRNFGKCECWIYNESVFFSHCLKSRKVKIRSMIVLRNCVRCAVYLKVCWQQLTVYFIYYTSDRYFRHIRKYSWFSVSGSVIKGGGKFLCSLINNISMSPVRFYEKGHEMIYYINYRRVVFMLLSLQMQPHSTVDLRIYFSQDESALYCD